MAWDDLVCATTPAPEFDIPNDKSAREKLLDILGVSEIPVSMTDENGETVTVLVLGRMG